MKTGGSENGIKSAGTESLIGEKLVSQLQGKNLSLSVTGGVDGRGCV